MENHNVQWKNQLMAIVHSYVHLPNGTSTLQSMAIPGTHGLEVPTKNIRPMFREYHHQIWPEKWHYQPIFGSDPGTSLGLGAGSWDITPMTTGWGQPSTMM